MMMLFLLTATPSWWCHGRIITEGLLAPWDETCCDLSRDNNIERGHGGNLPPRCLTTMHASCDENGRSAHAITRKHGPDDYLHWEIFGFLPCSMRFSRLMSGLQGFFTHGIVMASGFEAQEDSQLRGSKPHCLNHWIFTCKSYWSVAALVRPSSKDLVLVLLQRPAMVHF